MKKIKLPYDVIIESTTFNEGSDLVLTDNYEISINNVKINESEIKLRLLELLTESQSNGGSNMNVKRLNELMESASGVLDTGSEPISISTDNTDNIEEVTTPDILEKFVSYIANSNPSFDISLSTLDNISIIKFSTKEYSFSISKNNETNTTICSFEEVESNPIEGQDSIKE